MINRKKVKESAGVDSAMVLGDLTAVTQITRSGNTVTVHGDETRTMVLADEAMACQLWTALTDEAAAAVSEDRQFFCVSFGSNDPECTVSTLH